MKECKYCNEESILELLKGRCFECFLAMKESEMLSEILKCYKCDGGETLLNDYKNNRITCGECFYETTIELFDKLLGEEVNYD